MEVTLTPELEKLIEDHVTSGRYPSAGEVVRDALRLFMRDPEPVALEALRREIRAGIEELDRGDFTEYDEDSIKDLAHDVKTRGLARLRALGKPSR